MPFQVLLAQKVKRNPFMTNKCGMYNFSSNIGRLQTQNLRILEKIRKIVKTFRIIIECPVFLLRSKLFECLSKNRSYACFLEHDFTWKLDFVSDILWLIVSGNNFLLRTPPPPHPPHTPFQYWEFSIILVTIKIFSQF